VLNVPQARVEVIEIQVEMKDYRSVAQRIMASFLKVSPSRYIMEEQPKSR
jgi:hypothetical protein